ncbi:hypothetical protein Loa_02005 [Legionella oakridgensis ATCC 33761 = DSM 21215]|uniref:Uncharacterized protein n=1 Tax=Legionella oakridgensis ATCC 33761 = DSM 21215 TaxID=1268635 RepID=W0BGI8_9GAMM|nr:hypothetical protein Loa_02005 [Legionella oakridgensis ATCC 33761 = DSM 21215]ETO92795.1 hypothetical protein LOR_61c14490 [Legionella oakridgensis RV-2-2007]STY20592.1 Uncharacterised protein [Legionella longbeachae]
MIAEADMDKESWQRTVVVEATEQRLLMLVPQ